MSTHKKFKRKISKKTARGGLLDRYSPFTELFKVPATSLKKTVNVFESYQPEPGECLDYNISQTYVKWNVGETNINVTETHADYVPAPESFSKKKKKRKSYTGVPPISKTVDEIWLEERESSQRRGKQEFKQFRKKRKIADKMRGNCLHNTVLGMVGPDWYQQLSPKQLETVDHLERCILQDYVSKGYINTKENMAALGLVLRPNQQKLERALQICCGDPVEFLLTLYQLSNPKRKQYSVNDRLILSAVVHLTMTFTLRELHVRIPSPPRKPKVVQEELQEVKKAKYKSPYLVPYTFKPEPPAHTGEYINSQIQHPESPYFSYLEDLAGEMAQMREDPNLGIMSRGLDGTEIVYEIQAAQDYYNEIHETNKNCILPPTILVPLEKDQRNAIGDTKALLDDLKEMTVNAPFVKVQGIVFVNAGVVITNLGRVFFVQGSYQPCDLEHPIYQYEEKEQSLSALHTNIEDDCCNVGEQDVKCLPGAQQLNEFEESEREKSPAPACNEVHPTFEDSSNGDGCICTSKRIIGKPFNGEALFVNGGIAISRIGPAYLVSYSVVRVDEAQPLRRPRICCMKGAEDSGYWAAKGGACTCVAQRKAILRRYQHCYPVTYVIGGIVMTEVGPAYMVSSVCKKKEIKKPEVETADPDACKCKQEVDRFLKHRCECETCRAQERQDNATFIIAGMKGQEIDPPIPIISACVSQKNCNCLERYMEKLKTMHEYRQRLETRWRMMSIQNKYAIGGVVQTARGPMYMLTGIRPPIQCACAEMLRKQDEEKEARKRMPEPPPAGRIKYHIQGVRQMKCGQSVYILSQALPVEPCPCEELFNRFQGAHSRCMDRYKSFTSKIQEAHKDWGLGERWYESDQPIEEQRKPKTLRKKKKKKDFHATFLSNYDYDAQYSVTTPVQDRSSNMSFLTWDNVDDKSIDMRYDDRFDVIDDPCVKTTSKNYTAKSGTRLSRSKEKVSKKAVIIPEEKESEIKTFFPTIGDLDCSPTDLVQEEKKEAIGGVTVSTQESELPEPVFVESQEVLQPPELPDKPLCRPEPGDAYNFELTKPKSPCEPTDFMTTPCWESEASSSVASTASCRSDCQSAKAGATVASPHSIPKQPLCQCLPKAKAVHEPDELYGFKRYAILKKIPCDEKGQRKILKRVLEMMAEDGFVLARLPDAYKLPHFKLWMQMRCGKTWTRKDRDRLKLLSITLWGHTEICYQPVDVPHLRISHKKANAMTWNHANYLRQTLTAKYEEFYRALRKARINSAREFYPTTFSYEFPTRTFRDCYFAYLPAREEDLVFPTIEEKKFLKRYQCYC